MINSVRKGKCYLQRKVFEKYSNHHQLGKKGEGVGVGG